MYYFIVNPSAGSGSGMKKWKMIAALLKKQNLPYKVYFTRKSGDAVRFAQAITSRHEPLILAALGGDGTANEILNGICDFENTIFSYIPTGSSNDLARALNLPDAPEESLALLLNPEHIHTLDVGCIQSGEDSRRFFVSSGVGFDASVCHEALSSRLKKLLNRFHLGKLTYLGIALKQIMLLKGTPAKLAFDDGRASSFPRIFFCAFMNTKYEGGGFQMCPDALPDDGFLDVCLVEKVPKLKFLRVLPSAFSGRHTSIEEVHIYRCREAHIKTPRPLAVHADGESFHFRNTITVSLLDSKLKFIS